MPLREKFKRGTPIHKLPEPLRSQVEQRWYMLLCRYEREHGCQPPGWKRALLAAVAKRYVVMTEAGFDWSKWGKRLLSSRGGKATMRRFKAEGRNISELAWRASVAKRAARKRAQQPDFQRSWTLL